MIWQYNEASDQLNRKTKVAILKKFGCGKNAYNTIFTQFITVFFGIKGDILSLK